MSTQTLIAAFGFAGLLIVTGCGEESDAAGGASPSGTATADNEPDAAGDAVTLRADFHPVAGAPPQAETVRGIAEQRRFSDGATVSVELGGLVPNTDYIAHLHVGPCSLPDPGGAHFAFDPSGPDAPPNEVHLRFTSDAQGDGIAVTEVARPLPDGQAESVVVHAMGQGSHSTPKLACAQLG
ncbi:hypothetical protein ACN27E_21755 [Mycobacterium sp. WMMD1722]|uniref:hypothetical protein n=1 Tax=Mycobacterium sp. WMMD1722 TaxID=3404117 RepID=UPI003BF556B6